MSKPRCWSPTSSRGLADWDDVWVMQDGQIIEQGDYATLARAGGVFSALLAHRQEEI
ncbi:hypothetical protein LNQ52_30365 [Klebsiella pneumoniae subsp. pneumoniae]|nr:hypothetical protein [Klebsiella pneumoniae subsp. pneumoniae]